MDFPGVYLMEVAMQVQTSPGRVGQQGCFPRGRLSSLGAGGRCVQQPWGVPSLESLLAGRAHLSDFCPVRSLCRVLRDGEAMASGAQKPWKL